MASQLSLTARGIVVCRGREDAKLDGHAALHAVLFNWNQLLSAEVLHTVVEAFKAGAEDKLGTGNILEVLIGVGVHAELKIIINYNERNRSFN